MSIRIFETIGLVLHASPTRISAFLNILRVNREALPCRELTWNHIAASTETLHLTFGRAGIRNVLAGSVVQDLRRAGFGFTEILLERKKAKYSKKDRNVALRTGRPGVREGHHKWDTDGEQVWEECLQIRFSRDALFTMDHPIHDTLTAILQTYVWKRGRLLEQFDPGDTNGMALLELVMPKNRPALRSNELRFNENRGFWIVPHRNAFTKIPP